MLLLMSVMVAGGGAFAAATGELSLPAVYGSSMVFQHSTPSTLWGWGVSGASVSVGLTGNPTPITVKAMVASTGVWSASLPAQTPSNIPATITITSGTDTVTLADVVFGNVFLCSGQSKGPLCVDTASDVAGARLTGHACIALP